ncbi:MAG TPA: hypothetical protein VHL78_04710 [Actinomycetota bacterium]|nr:hypothetical protein [Actinomycetota bacterium]
MRRPQVGVGLNPFLLRSAVHAGLASDGRTDPWLLRLGGDVRAAATWAGCDIVMASERLDLPDQVVVAVLERGRRLEVYGPCVRRSMAYPGWDGLIQVLLDAAAEAAGPPIATR